MPRFDLTEQSVVQVGIYRTLASRANKLQVTTAVPVLTREQQDTFLRTAEIEDIQDIPIGVTESQYATLTDGTVSHRAHLQDVDIFKREFRAERGGTQINFHDSYKYNIAGHLLDKHLGLNMVPVSVEREINGRPYAVTWWIDDFAMDERERRGETAPGA